MSGTSVSNLDDFDRVTQDIRAEHALKLQELLTSTPHPHMPQDGEPNTITDIISDLLVDSYVRGLAFAQNDAQEVLSLLYGEIVNETASGGLREFREYLTNNYPGFLANDLVDEWLIGYYHIYSTFSKNDEFLNSFKTMGRTNRVQQGREFQRGIEAGRTDGWASWPKWIPPPTVDDTESDRVIEEVFQKSYMYQKIKSEYHFQAREMKRDFHAKISTGGLSITKSTLQTLYDVILQLRTTFLSVRVAVGTFLSGGSLFIFTGSSSKTAMIGRLWQADKAIELAIFKNPAPAGDVQAVFNRIAGLRDIDRVIAEYSSRSVMSISEWEQIATSRVTAAEEALAVSEANVAKIDKGFARVNLEVRDALDMKYAEGDVVEEYLNLQDANDAYFKAMGEQDANFALLKELREYVGYNDPSRMAELQADYEEAIELTRPAEQRWKLAKRYQALVRDEEQALDEMVGNRNALFDAQTLYESRSEATVLLDARKRQLISRMYAQDENGLSFDEATEKAWNDAMVPIDEKETQLRVQRRELNILRKRGNLPAAESKLAEVEQTQSEWEGLKASLKADTGIDANMGWRRSFLSQFDEAIAKARFKTRTNIKRVDVLDEFDEQLNAAEGLAEGAEEGVIIEEFIDFEGAALLENTVTFAGVEGAILDIAAAEFVLGFATSLLTNLVNIIFIYYSIESLEISLEMSQKQTAGMLAFNNPNLQLMITWWAKESSKDHAKTVAGEALKTEEYKSALRAAKVWEDQRKKELEELEQERIFKEREQIKSHMLGPGMFMPVGLEEQRKREFEQAEAIRIFKEREQFLRDMGGGGGNKPVISVNGEEGEPPNKEKQNSQSYKGDIMSDRHRWVTIQEYYKVAGQAPDDPITNAITVDTLERVYFDLPVDEATELYEFMKKYFDYRPFFIEQDRAYIESAANNYTGTFDFEGRRNILDVLRAVKFRYDNQQTQVEEPPTPETPPTPSGELIPVNYVQQWNEIASAYKAMGENTFTRDIALDRLEDIFYSMFMEDAEIVHDYVTRYTTRHARFTSSDDHYVMFTAGQTYDGREDGISRARLAGVMKGVIDRTEPPVQSSDASLVLRGLSFTLSAFAELVDKIVTGGYGELYEVKRSEVEAINKLLGTAGDKVVVPQVVIDAGKQVAVGAGAVGSAVVFVGGGIITVMQNGYLGAARVIQNDTDMIITAIQVVGRFAKGTYTVIYDNARGLLWVAGTGVVIVGFLTAAGVPLIGAAGAATLIGVSVASGVAYKLTDGGRQLPSLGGLGLGMTILGIGYIVSQTGLPDMGGSGGGRKRRRIQKN